MIAINNFYKNVRLVMCANVTTTPDVNVIIIVKREKNIIFIFLLIILLDAVDLHSSIFFFKKIVNSF